ncbi:MAG: efflux RND transporter periplasmic adaptor subunit [Niabella sp.]
MQQIIKSIFFLALIVAMASCGGGKEKGKLGDKKAALEKLKGEQKKINDQIVKLEDEIAKLDPTAAKKTKLVSVETIGTNAFNHYIDLQGKIDAKNTAYVSPKMPGVVRAIYVKEGDYVRKGQAIIKLDDAVSRQQYTAAQQQADVVRAQLKLAKTTLERQQNLWDNNIGAEMQVIQARTNVNTLSSQLKAAEAQAALAREQLDFSNVRADISGTINQVNVRVGEQFSGVGATGAQVTIVNTSVLKLLVNVPEVYVDKVRVGAPLRVTLPDDNSRVITTKASVVSKLIDPVSRTFYVEAGVPSDPDIRANQLAKVQILDYARADAITIPVNTLQTDEQGKYVLVAVNENGKLIARKKKIIIGELYGERLEVKSGLNTGDNLITQGFQDLYEGQTITTQ